MPESPKFIERYTSALPEPHCDHCGFALQGHLEGHVEGLGARGNCPECGTDFDPQSVTIARRIRRLRVVGYLTLPFGVAVLFLLLLIIAANVWSGPELGPLSAALLFVPVPLAGAWLGYRATRLTPVVFGRCMPRRRAQSTAAVLASGLCLAIGFFMMFSGVLLAAWVLVMGFMIQSGVDA
ncbi:MAG: hypothetical protein RL591_2657 [Planctomycetota bacterium]|jgi:hypothetical protein